MPLTSNRSFKALGLAVALGAALTIHGTMLWGFDGIAAQAAASCAADNAKTASARPATLPPAQPATGAAATKAATPA